MSSAEKSISALSILGMKIQGWSCSVRELTEYRLGIRLAYGACALIVLLGLVFQSAHFYVLGLIVTIGGMVLPRHPIDYLYNATIRKFFQKPAIPKRPPQNRFACSIATVWLGVLLLCWKSLLYWIANAMAGALIMQACIVAFTDICFPSMIYNFLRGNSQTNIH